MESPLISLSTSLKLYKRADIQQAMVDASRSREVAIRFNKGFGKRPDVLNHPRDILEFAKQGATSFHVSEEHWTSPMALSPEMTPREQEDLRSGWDLVLDIDCHFLEYSKIAAKICIDALRSHGIDSVSVKFSGNKGFHIGVPFASFPKRVSNKDVRELFPDGARRIALYLKQLIAKSLSEAIMNFEERDFHAIVEKTGKQEKEIIKDSVDRSGIRVRVLDATPFLDIDTILISSRHLYRMPYSLHEKSGLVSIPLDPDAVMLFERESARPEKVKLSEQIFLDTRKSRPDEARALFIQALDFEPPGEQLDESVMKQLEKRVYEMPEEAIPPRFFPECIKKMLMGLKDGRKRALFVLVNFLSNVGWDWEQIAEFLKEWNQRNKPPLSQTLITGQVRYRKSQKKLIMPPNSTNKNYYDDIGCAPDALCLKMKNPVNYAKMKARGHKENETKRPKKASKQ